MAGALRVSWRYATNGWRRAVDLLNSDPGRVLSATETAELRLWYGADAAADVSCNQLVNLRYADIASCTAT